MGENQEIASNDYLSASLILQTLQQLRDVYGDSVDRIIQGNVANIIFLKSTDDQMIEQLEKMSGKTHKSSINSKTLERDVKKIMNPAEGRVSYNMTTEERPVISYNDMAFISERNSMVFRAGDSPIWNRNETILPMSWRLFQNTIVQPGKEYSLQTIPTLSSAKDFDVRKNQPDFGKMLEKRKKQALASELATDVFQTAHGYSEYEMTQLDPDVKADDIMDIIRTAIREVTPQEDIDNFDYMGYEEDDMSFYKAEENKEQIAETEASKKEYDTRQKKLYAGGLLSKANLISMGGQIQHGYDNDIAAVYNEIKAYLWKDTKHFIYDEATETLYGKDNEIYIRKKQESEHCKIINDAIKSGDSSVYSDNDLSTDDYRVISGYIVFDAFYKFLTSMDRWDFAEGRFEQEMARILNR